MKTSIRLASHVILLALSVMLSPAAAQDWSRIYRPAHHSNPVSAERTDDGGFIIAGNTYIETPPTIGYFLSKLDRSGRVLWDSLYTRSAPDSSIVPQQFLSMRKGRDEEFLMAGYANIAGSTSALVYAVDRNGRVIWRTGIPHPEESHAHVLIERSAGGYFVAGHYASSMWLVRMSQEGRVLWEKTYKHDNSVLEHVHSAVETEDGGCLLAGHTTVDDQERYRVIKTDSNGVEEWSREISSGDDYHDDPSRVVRTANGDYAIFGTTAGRTKQFLTTWLLVLDPAGRTKVDAHFGRMTGETACLSGIATVDGGYLLTGYTNELDTVGGVPTMRYYSYLLHVDGQGAMIRDWKFVGELATCVMEFPDAYMLVGVRNGNGEIVLRNLGKDGAEEETLRHTDVWSYPNPGTTNQSVTIEINGAVPADRKLDVYDDLGRHVATIEGIELTTTRHRYLWNLGTDDAAVPPGVYFYAIQGDAGMLRGSTVILEGAR